MLDRPDTDECRGCGQRPEQFPPIEAVASLRLLQRRSIALSRQPHPEDSRIFPPGRPAPSPGVDAAARIPAVLASVDRQLRHLFADPEPLTTVMEKPPREPGRVAAALASVPDTAERLVRTIASATAEDWYRHRPHHDVTAAELTWLAVHEATHCIDEVEQARRAQPPAAVARDVQPTAPATIHRFPDKAETPRSLLSLKGGNYPPALTAPTRRHDSGGFDEAS